MPHKNVIFTATFSDLYRQQSFSLGINHFHLFTKRIPSIETYLSAVKLNKDRWRPDWRLYSALFCSAPLEGGSILPNSSKHGTSGKRGAEGDKTRRRRRRNNGNSGLSCSVEPRAIFFFSARKTRKSNKSGSLLFWSGWNRLVLGGKWTEPPDSHSEPHLHKEEGREEEKGEEQEEEEKQEDGEEEVG